MASPASKDSGARRRVLDESKLRDRSPSLFQFNDKLLQDPARLYQFKKFVETEYADENLLFYLDVSQWRALTSPAAKQQRGDEILSRYIRPDSEKLINIEVTSVAVIVVTKGLSLTRSRRQSI